MCTRKRIIEIKKPEDMKNAWKVPSQMLSKWNDKGISKMMVKCGYCYECKKERARNWTYKIWLEAKDHEDKCFITLTYKDDKNGTQQVEKRELQLFIKRLRKHIYPKKIKYFAAGEYGEKKGRPHYHIIILGWKPEDIRPMRRKSKKGKLMYTSDIVHKLWQEKGIVTVQTFAPNEVGYLTLYIGNNEYMNNQINDNALEKRKEMIRQIKIKHGAYTNWIRRDFSGGNGKLLKNFTKEEYKKYKEDYNKYVPKIKIPLQNEFNLFSQGMGFEKWLKDKYYKYDLVIDGRTYEIPKDYIRKVIDNMDEYPKEVVENVIYKSLERKKHAEENYVNPDNYEAVMQERYKEMTQYQKEFANKKLYKHVESEF